MMMSGKEQYIWLAGLLEGEGCFTVRHPPEGRYKSPKVQIYLKMTDKDVVDAAAAIMNTNVNPLKMKDSKRKQAWVTVASSVKAELIMRQILPYMGYRRSEKINEALSALDMARCLSEPQ